MDFPILSVILITPFVGVLIYIVIQVLGGPDKLLPTLTDLASALGLTPRP